MFQTFEFRKATYTEVEAATVEQQPSNAKKRATKSAAQDEEPEPKKTRKPKAASKKAAAKAKASHPQDESDIEEVASTPAGSEDDAAVRPASKPSSKKQPKGTPDKQKPAKASHLDDAPQEQPLQQRANQKKEKLAKSVQQQRDEAPQLAESAQASATPATASQMQQHATQEASIAGEAAKPAPKKRGQAKKPSADPPVPNQLSSPPKKKSKGAHI